MIPIVLKLLVRLPINWQSLKDNGKIGKTVKKLSGHSDKKIKKQAKDLLRMWKKLASRQTKKTSGVKRKLENKEEPPAKKRLTASSAFRTKESIGVTSPSELKIVKRSSTVITKEPSTSNKVIRKTNKSSEAKAEKPTYKPLPRLQTRTIEEPNTLRNSLDSIPRTPLSKNSGEKLSASSGNGDITMVVSTKSCDVPAKDKQPLASCLPSPSKEKKGKSISWAPNEKLVFVKYFPRDKSLSIDNPNMRMIKARMAQQAQFNQQQQQQQKQPEIPQMKPSIRWNSPPLINLPSNLPIPSGENSIEANVQRERERSTLRANYPDVKHIPPTPASDPLENQPVVRDEDISVIPLHDTMKEAAQKQPPINYNTQPSVPQHNRHMNYNQPPQNAYNMNNSYPSGYPPQQPNTDLFSAFAGNNGQMNNTAQFEVLRQLLSANNNHNPMPYHQPYQQPQPNYPPPNNYQHQQQQNNNFSPYGLPGRSGASNQYYPRY